MEQKRTVFQSLGHIFDLTPNQLKPNSQPIDFDGENKKEIITSVTNREDKDIFNLQSKQQTHLSSQFLRLVSNQKEKTLNYESNRLQQYFDYETMDGYPIISAALDLLCEESTTIGQNGKMLNIFSPNKSVRRELERLFYKVIDINITLSPWIRNLCKYGDNFIYLILDEQKGVIGTRQLPNIEIDRIEEEVDGKIRVKFINKQRRNDEYNTWQIGHFRLLGDDRRLPYGMSVLDKVRRTYKMLSMAEDAMLVYRITRAAERRVVKVNVGNAPAEDVPMLLQAAATQFHGKSPLIDKNSGDINFKYSVATNDSDIFIPVRTDNASNPIDTLQGACLVLDTKIELLDGRSLTLAEIINEYQNGKQLWTYSINPISGEIVPGKITNASITRKNADVLKITLDNGETITCTHDHKFPTKLNGIKEAKDLLVNESLWSFNKKNKSETEPYEMVYNHLTKKFEYTDEIIYNFFSNFEEVINTHFNNNLSNQVFNEYIKIVSIEYLDSKMDTGTITVDGFEEYHNYHNFALSCGVFTQNSNLNDINDITYLRSNLFTGIGIPKSFLSFSSDDPNEKGGANLSMLDIRFSRKVNRIQQAAISELNKIAIVHLYTLGGEYAKNIDNFTLSLTNPSTQAEMLKIEELSTKLDVYAKAVTAIDGIKPMSQAEAMIKILGKSHDEVLETLQDQIVEIKVGAEIVAGDQLLKNSKLFNKLIKYYNAGIIGNPNGEENQTDGEGGEGGGMPSEGGNQLDEPNIDDAMGDTLKENKSLIYENQQMIKDLEKMMEEVDSFQKSKK